MKEDLLKLLTWYGSRNCHPPAWVEEHVQYRLFSSALIEEVEQHPGYYKPTRKGQALYDTICRLMEIATDTH